MTTLLRRGSKGEDVKELQEFLNVHGFDAGPPDGIYGANTENAVRIFQESAGIAADGICGPNTFGAISGQKFEDAMNRETTVDAEGGPAPA